MGIASIQSCKRERRHWPRHSISGSDVVPIDAGVGETGGLLLNLAPGGAAMQLLGGLQPDATHPFRWRLSPEDRWIEAQGVIVWSGANHTCGIRFVNLSGGARERIESWLTEGRELRSGSTLRPSLPADELSNLPTLAKALLEADGAAFVIAKGSDFVCVSSSGYAPPPASQLLYNECLTTGKVVYSSDLANDPHYQSASQVSLCSSMIVAPVTCAGQMIGILECCWTHLREFSNHDIKTLCSLTDVSPSPPAPVTKQFVGKATASVEVGPVQGPIMRDRDLLDACLSPAVPIQRRRHWPGLSVVSAVALCFGIAFAAGWLGHSWTFELTSNTLAPPTIAKQQFPVPSLQQPPPVARQQQQNTPSALRERLNSVGTPTRTVPLLQPAESRAKSAQPPLDPPPLQLPIVELKSSTDTQNALRKLLALRDVIPQISPPSPDAEITSGSEPPLTKDVVRASPPVLIKKIQPVYPEGARLLRRTGTVVLDALVDTKGNVTQVRLVRGDPMLAQAARAAISRWHYKPAEIDGRKVEGEVRVTVNFNPQ